MIPSMRQRRLVAWAALLAASGACAIATSLWLFFGTLWFGAAMSGIGGAKPVASGETLMFVLGRALPVLATYTAGSLIGAVLVATSATIGWRQRADPAVSAISAGWVTLATVCAVVVAIAGFLLAMFVFNWWRVIPPLFLALGSFAIVWGAALAGTAPTLPHPRNAVWAAVFLAMIALSYAAPLFAFRYYQ